MFKDSFITICRAHHLALRTERSYWFCVRKYIKWLWRELLSDPTGNCDPTGNFRRYLSAMANEGVSASTQNQTWHALRFMYEKVVDIQLGDLSNIPRATGRQRIVDVPTDELAQKIVNAEKGKVGLMLKIIYETGRRPAALLKDDQFKDMDGNAVYMGMRRIRAKLRLKRNYTSTSIRYAGIRRIALRDGFLAAHKALGVKDASITESVLLSGRNGIPRAPSPI